MKHIDIARIIEEKAPLVYAEEWDNPGFQFGAPDDEVKKILVALDFNDKVLHEAVEKGANLIITHHPFLFKATKKITTDSADMALIIEALKNNITLYSAHTNLDNAFHGLNYYVASLLGLHSLEALQPCNNVLYKIVTFVPSEAVKKVESAIFKAGAGAIGNYDCCSFKLPGTGSFRAMEGANPYVGNIGEIHLEDEVRIEVTVPEHLKKNVVDSIVKNHPYEEPVYDVYRIDNPLKTTGSGVVGLLDTPIDEQSFLQLVHDKLAVQCLRYSNLTGKTIKKVALCTGAGAFLINRATSLHCDAFITGDVRHHEFYVDKDLLLVDAGHFETEIPSSQWFIDTITAKLGNIDIHRADTADNHIHVWKR